ncbi:MAG: hypothetical protein PHY80_05625 [Rickettsiales bacterium]|nr:hypothetical protein [Rickettsiales bacterium]
MFSLFFLLAKQSLALANPACAVCAIAIGASLELARYFGVSDNVVGLWSGALMALIGYFTILWFDKKNWQFKGRDTIAMLLSLSMIGFMYIGEIQYSPKILGFLDPFLFSSIVGFIIFITSQKFYEWMKKNNGDHAHFPFEKVVLPVIMLFLLSLWFNNIRF